MNCRCLFAPSALMSLLAVLAAGEVRVQTPNPVGAWVMTKKLDAEGVYWISNVQLKPDGTFTDSSGFPNPAGADHGTWALTPPDMINLWYVHSKVFLDGTLNSTFTYQYGVIDNGIIGDYCAFRVDFTPQIGVAPSAVTYSSTITVKDAFSSYTISIASCTGTSCEFKINDGTWASDPATAVDGDTVQVRQTSSPSWGTTTELTLAMSGNLPGRIGSGSTTFSVTTSPPATAFYTLTPCRLVDTRNANGPLGGPVMTAGVERSFAVAGECEIPTDAKGLALNITAIGATDAGVFSVMSASDVWNDTSVLHFPAGRARAGNAIVALPLAGGATFKARFTGSGTAHVIIDVTGYFK